MILRFYGSTGKHGSKFIGAIAVCLTFLAASAMRGHSMGADSTRPKQELKLVIIGASYARGWTDFSPENMKVLNKGVNGEQSFEMLARFKKDVIDEKADVVIIWGFINDIFRSGPQEIDAALDRARRSIVEMTELAKASGIRPVIATEVTIRGRAGIREWLGSFIGRLRGAEGYQDYINRHVLRTNQWLRDYARAKGIDLLDFQPLLAEKRGERRREYAREDGSHISPAGYDCLSQFTGLELSKRAVSR